MDWQTLLPTIIPSIVAIVLAIVAWVLKLKKDSMTGMSKELSELVLAIMEASRDKNFTQAEILKIIKEGKDVIGEAEKLLKP